MIILIYFSIPFLIIQLIHILQKFNALSMMINLKDI